MDILIKIFATGFGFGYLRPFSGTWGSLPGLLICYLLYPLGLSVQFAVIGIAFFISVIFAGRGEKIYGHDNKRIVIDEILGMAVTMLMVPAHDWRYYLLGFVLFRIFDVAKLEPASFAEKLPGGWGVTMDDLVAGCYALITLQLLANFLIRL